MSYLDLHRFDIEDVELDESLLLGLVGSFGPCLRFLRLSNVSLGQSTFDQIPGALEKRGISRYCLCRETTLRISPSSVNGCVCAHGSNDFIFRATQRISKEMKPCCCLPIRAPMQL